MDNRTLEIILRARDEASKTIEQAGGKISRSFDDAKHASYAFAAGLAAVGATAAAVVGMGAKVAADLETARMGFITLLGSAEKADKILAQIKIDAAKTPFELPGLVTANQLLTSVTKDGQRSETFLLNIGKALAAMGKGQNELDRIIVNLQQIGAVGKASMIDLKQFAFAGIPIFQLLQEHTGATGAELEDMISQGKITFEMLEELFNKAGTAGGQFAKAFTDQSGTFNQSLSNAKDTLNIFLADLVTSTGLFDLLKDALKGFVDYMNAHGDEIIAGVRDGLKWIRENGPIVAGIIIGGLTPAIIAFGGAVIAATIALLPYIAAGAALGLVAKLIIDNWGGITGTISRVIDVFRSLWNYFGLVITDGDHLNDWLTHLPGPLQTVARTIGQVIVWFQALAQYLRLVVEDGDYLNDWLTHLPAPLQFVAMAMAQVIVFFQNLPNTVRAAAEAIGSAVQATIMWFQQLPGRVWAFLSDLFINKIPYAVGFAGGFLATAIPLMVENIIQWFSELPGRIGAVFSAIWSTITTTVQAIWNYLAVIIPQIALGIAMWLMGVPGAVLGIFLRTKDNVVGGVSSTWTFLSSTLSGWASGIANFISGIPGIVGKIFEDMKNAAIDKIVQLFHTLSDWWNKIKAIFDAIKGAAEAAIGKVREGFEAGQRAGMRAFADGGWVNQTGPAIVHSGEFVLSRDMLSGREPIPSTVPTSNDHNATINVGPVYVQGMADIDALTHRLGFYYQTAGNL